MKLYIELQGCDDTTRFSFETDDPEPIRRLAAMSRQASEYGCQPTMTVHVAVEDHEINQYKDVAAEQIGGEA